MTYPWNKFQGYSSDNRVFLATNHREIEVLVVLRVHDPLKLTTLALANSPTSTLAFDFGSCTARFHSTEVVCDALASPVAASSASSPQAMTKAIVEEVVALFEIALVTFGMVMHHPAVRPPL